MGEEENPSGYIHVALFSHGPTNEREKKQNKQLGTFIQLFCPRPANENQFGYIHLAVFLWVN
jgi:hypothetical protein